MDKDSVAYKSSHLSSINVEKRKGKKKMKETPEQKLSSDQTEIKSPTQRNMTNRTKAH